MIVCVQIRLSPFREMRGSYLILVVLLLDVLGAVVRDLDKLSNNAGSNQKSVVPNAGWILANPGFRLRIVIYTCSRYVCLFVMLDA